MFRIRYYCALAAVLLAFLNTVNSLKLAKDNGDIYVANETLLMTTEASHEHLNLEEVSRKCNESFSIPMDYLLEFNTTAELPDIVDKTGMCFIRCFYEKSGFIENWKLIGEKVRHYMWSATGDTLDYCEMQGKSEQNACIRTYLIAKCLMIRAIVDARNKPMV